MSIKRYFSNADTTITNAFKESLTVRGTGSNMGAADILEVFQIYGQEVSSSSELSRVLVSFPVSDISADRTAGSLPAAGSVSFYLRLYNAEHSRTTPKNFSMTVDAVSSSWQEGVGLDMESYADKTYDKLGSNWIKSSGSTSWTSVGGDYHSSPTATATFTTGLEHLEVDVTDIVEEWITGSADGGKENYGFGVRLSSTYESLSKTVYTKKFFSRTSQFFHKRPTLEARWNSSTTDQRGDFYISSSLLSSAENNNVLYLYNKVRGQLVNIPDVGTDSIYVNLYESLGGSALTLCGDTPATGSHVSAGVYKVSLCTTSTASTLYDVWFSGSTQYHTGTIAPKSFSALTEQDSTDYLLSLTNLKESYGKNEMARFRLYVRPRDWSPTIYTTANATPSNIIIPTASYEICRSLDNFKVVPYGTGSTKHTILSYDVNGNYFDLDMNMFEAGYSYTVKFAFYDSAGSSYVHQPYEFKFRVREDVY
jgi:hypothetical protein